MWALIFIAVTRYSEPQYVEIYQTKQECMALVEPGGFLQTRRNYCVPVAQATKKESK